MPGDPSFSAHQEQGESGQEGMDSTLSIVFGASSYTERDSKDLSISLDWILTGVHCNRQPMARNSATVAISSGLPTVATANEIKELFLNYQAAGVSFHQALKREPWCARTFIGSDPAE